MKGFYFSLDALLASSVLLATFLMMLTQPTPRTTDLDDYRLDRVHLANTQITNEWNSTYDSQKTVSHTIAKNYYGGSKTKAEEICTNYFGLSAQWAVYLSNSTVRDKICGNYDLYSEDTLVSESTAITDFRTENGYHGLKKLTMVIKN